MYEKDPYYLKCNDEKSNLLDRYMLILLDVQCSS